MTWILKGIKAARQLHLTTINQDLQDIKQVVKYYLFIGDVDKAVRLHSWAAGWLKADAPETVKIHQILAEILTSTFQQEEFSRLAELSMDHFFRINVKHPNMPFLLEGQLPFFNLNLEKHLSFYYRLVVNLTDELKNGESTMQAMMMLRIVGWHYWRLGDKPQAIFCIEKAVALGKQYVSSDTPQRRETMAYFYVAMLFKLSFHGEFAEAIKLINWANKTFFFALEDT